MWRVEQGQLPCRHKKASMPNVVQTVHKAEIIRLYEAYCEKEGHTDKPSTRTLWNMLFMCPASQRESLAGLDKVVVEGADSFDVLVNILNKGCVFLLYAGPQTYFLLM